MATHNMEIVNKFKKRVVGLEKGKVVKDEKNKDEKVEKAEHHKETHKKEKDPDKQA